MNRPVVRIAAAAVAAVLVVLSAAAAEPRWQPQAERLLIAVLAVTVLAAVALALVRAHPAPAATSFAREPTTGRERAPLPSELRWIAGTFASRSGVGAWRGPVVGGRSSIQRLGRERLRARGLDIERPEHAVVARRLAGEHLWTIVVTPLEVPLNGIDVNHALAHLEAL